MAGPLTRPVRGDRPGGPVAPHQPVMFGVDVGHLTSAYRRSVSGAGYGEPVLFERRLREGIDDGSVTLMFRRWQRRQAVPGHRYRTGTAMIEVDSVEVVEPAGISDRDARQASYRDAAALVADLRGDASLPVYRVAFHRLDEPDPRRLLAADDRLGAEQVADISRRLARLDGAAATGPWTGDTLAMIGQRPGVRAGDLAESLGRDMLPFKQDVRKLKALGLTESLAVGYRLSPRGAAYLRITGR